MLIVTASTFERGEGSRGKFPGPVSPEGPKKILLVQKRGFNRFRHLIQSLMDPDGEAE